MSFRTPKSHGMSGSSDDAIIESSEGVRFTVNRQLLCYASPVFKDMYEIAPSFSSVKQAVKLSESAAVLRMLLAYLDPKMSSPPTLPIGTLWECIEASKKYHITALISRFRAILTSPTILHGDRPINLIILNPLPVAVLAHAFEFTEELRMTLRELARCHINVLMRNKQGCTLPSVLFQYILQLRRSRAIWLKAKAKSLLYLPAATPPQGKLLALRSGSNCPYCIRFRAEHLHEACIKIDDQPSWDTFRAEMIQRIVKCTCDAPTIPWEGTSETFNREWHKWENDTRALEVALPDWPLPKAEATSDGDA